jgi:hypothetical protein
MPDNPDQQLGLAPAQSAADLPALPARPLPPLAEVLFPAPQRQPHGFATTQTLYELQQQVQALAAQLQATEKWCQELAARVAALEAP